MNIEQPPSLDAEDQAILDRIWDKETRAPVIFDLDDPLLKSSDHWKQQPRAPAGSHEGGQWAAASAGVKAARKAKKQSEAPAVIIEPPTTAEKYSDPYTHTYQPARHALQESIIEELMAPPRPDLQPLYEKYDEGQPSMVVLVGGPGAGKSTWIEGNLPHHRFARVDADAVKERLPEYDPGNPTHVHQESRHIAQRMMQRCIAEGRSFVYDSTGIDVYGIQQAIQAAKAEGFHVAVHCVTVPVETAIQRVAARERKVPEDIVRNRHEEVPWAFEQLAKVADFSAVHDNSEEKR